MLQVRLEDGRAPREPLQQRPGRIDPDHGEERGGSGRSQRALGDRLQRRADADRADKERADIAEKEPRAGPIRGQKAEEAGDKEQQAAIPDRSGLLPAASVEADAEVQPQANGQRLQRHQTVGAVDEVKRVDREQRADQHQRQQQR